MCWIRPITGKEGELQKLRSALGKNRRIVKKLEEIEAIETGKTTAPKAKKSAAKKTDKADPAPATDSKADKSTGKKIGTGSKAT